MTVMVFMIRGPPRSPLFPCTTLFRSRSRMLARPMWPAAVLDSGPGPVKPRPSSETRSSTSSSTVLSVTTTREASRSEEHTSELQSRQYLACRLLLEEKHQLHYIHSLL